MKKLFQIFTILLVLVFVVSCTTTDDDKKTFTVVFDANTGIIEGNASILINEGDSVTEAMLPKASKENYTFEGWFLNSRMEGESVKFPLAITQDTVLYAGYKEVTEVVVKHKVTVDLNGANGNNQVIEIISGEQLLEAKMPTVSRENYKFLGWFMSVAGSDAKVRFPLTVTEDILIFAKWEEIVTLKHQVTFDANGGVLTGESVFVVEDGQTILAASVPTVSYEKHEFLGWFLNKEGTGTQVTFPYKPTRNTTIYAVWKAEKEDVIVGDNFKYLYEAENAIITGTPSYGEGFIEEVEIASGGKSVGNLGLTGNAVEFKINASSAGKAIIEFVFSSSTLDWAGGMILPDQAINPSKLEIKLNGIVLEYDEMIVKGNDVPMGFNQIFTTVSIDNIDLIEGENTLKLTALGDEFPNFDCIMIKTDVELDGVKIVDDYVGDNFKYLYETENAIITGTPSYGEGFIEEVEIASGGKSVGNLGLTGNAVEFKINASSAGKAIIEFVFSSSTLDWAGGMILPDQAINPSKLEIKLNGIVLEYDEMIVKGNDVPMGFNQIFTTVSIDNIDLIEGENTLKLTALGDEFPNFDCIMIKTEVELDGVKIADDSEPGTTPPVEEKVIYEGNIDFTLIVDSLPAGPAFDKAIIEFEEPIKLEDLLLQTFEFSYTSTAWGTRVVKLGNKMFYLSDRDGNEIEDSISTFVTVVFDTTYTASGFAGSTGAFEYVITDWTTFSGKNQWINFETLKLNLGENLVIGETQYTELNQSNITFEVEIPKLNGWVLDGEFNYNDEVHGDIKLTFAAYEPEKLKGSEKNPLIIWLHGAGEGGTDTRVVLLGNEVTGISSEKIQSYFISGEEVGAYVLAVQTPTMWMDNGTGAYGNDSMYLNALWATIKAYVDSNPDIDTSRIYIGGCSNGGFMTMQMLITDIENYFAAAFPICQAYSYDLLDALVKEELSERAIWFIQAATDNTVNAETTNKLYVDLINLGAENVFYSYFNEVILNGVKYDSHYSWIYPLQDLAINIQPVSKESGDLTIEDLDFNSELTHPEFETMWDWLAAQNNK